MIMTRAKYDISVIKFHVALMVLADEFVETKMDMYL